MTESPPAHDKLLDLRESLRRLDVVLGMARRVIRESGETPDGVLEEFIAARAALEKQFVKSFEALDLDALQAFRAFLRATRELSPGRLQRNIDKLCRRTRSLLNHLLIAEGPAPRHGSEVGGVRFNDHDPPHQPPPINAPPVERRFLRRALTAAVILTMLAMVGFTAAWFAGAFAPPAELPSVSRFDPPPASTARPPDEPSGPIEPGRPFDPAAVGYAHPLRLQLPSQPLDPLSATSGSLIMDSLPAFLLGLEELVQQIEPQRLRASPEQTLATWTRFAEGVVERESQWVEARKPLLDSFVAHLRTELHLARYPASESEATVLPSDVLYAAGGSQLPLIITSQALAQACSLPVVPIAPNGPIRPELALRLPNRIDTWNGELLGLRTGVQPLLEPRTALIELSRLLRPTMRTSAGRAVADALVLHLAGELDADSARLALADFQLAWLLPPEESASAAALLTYRAAKLLQPEICRVLLGEQGDVSEALSLYRLAEAASNEPQLEAALLLLGSRAAPGEMLGGEPLALLVGRLLEQRGRAAEALPWYRRAHTEHPDDPRATLRLANLLDGAERFAMLREAYARGERTASFLRGLARSAANHDEHLLALTLLDELLQSDRPAASDLENAALQCLALERTDWALARLRAHPAATAAEPRLIRLELICELSLNGLSERARELAADWRAHGRQDSFVDGLLRRFGG